MTIADSNVILDILGEDTPWRRWSLARLDEVSEEGDLAVNPVIYAEISPRFAHVEDLDQFLTQAGFTMLDFSRRQAFAAGAAHRRYRRNGGERRRVLADFLIGAQAQATGRAVLTRDPNGYRAYFPDVRLITP